VYWLFAAEPERGVSSLPSDAKLRKVFEKPKDPQEPKHNGNYYHAIQYPLDLTLHWNKTVYQPKQKTNHDESKYDGNERHVIPYAIRIAKRGRCQLD